MVRWRQRRGEGLDQIEDRRGNSGRRRDSRRRPRARRSADLARAPVPRRKFGGGGGTAINPDVFLEPLAPAGGQTGPAPSAGEDLVDFVGVRRRRHPGRPGADIFSRSGRTYEPTKLVLFKGTTQSGCGFASEESGPFYCPAGQEGLPRLTFFRDLETRFGAPGDFAGAYVIAHEFGHHVQNITGIAEDVRTRQQSDPGSANELSIRLELQADCLAGIWAQFGIRPGRSRTGRSSRKASLRPPRSATTGSRASPEESSTRSPGRTDRPNNGRSGSDTGLRVRRSVSLRHVRGLTRFAAPRAEPLS